MKRAARPLCALFLCAVCAQSPAQAEVEAGEAEAGMERARPVPLTAVFHQLGWNFLGSLSYNYGLPFALAGAGTWAFVETGLDWQINRFAYRHSAAARAGLPLVYIGYIMPFALPAGLYLTGLWTGNEKAQFAALAGVQAAGIVFALQSVAKMVTGRAAPGIINVLNHQRSGRTDDFSGEFNWFTPEIVQGWPSGHSANAFAEAALLSEFYPDNLALRIAAYGYAAVVAAGVSLNVHWASDALAGALIGYAVGKAVGKSFAALYKKTAAKEGTAALAVTPGFVGIRWALP